MFSSSMVGSQTSVVEDDDDDEVEVEVEEGKEKDRQM